MDAVVSLETLPTQIQKSIFQHLDVFSMLQARVVSCYWKQKADEAFQHRLQCFLNPQDGLYEYPSDNSEHNELYLSIQAVSERPNNHVSVQRLARHIQHDLSWFFCLPDDVIARIAPLLLRGGHVEADEENWCEIDLVNRQMSILDVRHLLDRFLEDMIDKWFPANDSEAFVLELRESFKEAMALTWYSLLFLAREPSIRVSYYKVVSLVPSPDGNEDDISMKGEILIHFRTPSRETKFIFLPFLWCGAFY